MFDEKNGSFFLDGKALKMEKQMNNKQFFYQINDKLCVCKYIQKIIIYSLYIYK